MKLSAYPMFLLTVLGLAACAGGSMQEPKSPVVIPSARAVQPENTVFYSSDARTLTLNTAGGKLRVLDDAGKAAWAYQAADGKIYPLNEFTNPMVPDSFSPSFKFPTQQAGQVLEGGGKLLACCIGSGQFSYGPATRLEHVRFGAWAGEGGAADLFVGGQTADPSYMPSGGNAAVSGMKGKATYEVLALRVRNGGFVNSSYTPHYNSGADNPNSRGEPVRSLLTANFNTAKLGGTIVGNADFGADIVLKNVSINGNAFSGSAVSDGKGGLVSGHFFGEPGRAADGRINSPATREIGGKITFDADSSLNAVFGGQRIGEKTDDTSADLNPLP